MLRLLRLIRVMRLIRILRAISDLRTLVGSILSSMKALGWTVVLLVLMIYTISLYITQIVADRVIQDKLEGEVTDLEAMVTFYGSMGDTMLSLFQAICGGVDWRDILVPLMDHIHPWMAVVFSLYVAFSILCMLNVVTGVFVESVLKSAKADKDVFLVHNACELFASLEGGIQCLMTWDLFKNKLDAPQMQEFFKAINVDCSEAKGLFHLLDLDNSGSISAEEFLNGALRLSGSAKALDMALLIQEVKDISKRLRAQEHRYLRTMQLMGNPKHTPRHSRIGYEDAEDM
jgi:hypothetical protein